MATMWQNRIFDRTVHVKWNLIGRTTLITDGRLRVMLAGHNKVVNETWSVSDPFSIPV
jgi:hypothetical protein